MAPLKRKKDAEPDAPKIGAWMVTFSDCMTLLLCFFVLLLTFSSFDKIELDKLSGAFPNMAMESIFPNPLTIKDAIVPPKENPVDHTAEGSEKPTAAPPASIKNPRRSPADLDPEAYRDRKVLSIPSSRLFYGRGSSLTAGGKELLEAMASFLRRMPCQVIIGQTGGQGGDASLARALAVMRYLTVQMDLPNDRFGISAGNSLRPGRPEESPKMRIVLLARGLYK